MERTWTNWHNTILKKREWAHQFMTHSGNMELMTPPQMTPLALISSLLNLTMFVVFNSNSEQPHSNKGPLHIDLLEMMSVSVGVAFLILSL